MNRDAVVINNYRTPGTIPSDKGPKKVATEGGFVIRGWKTERERIQVISAR